MEIDASVERGAQFSVGRDYRYVLWRTWEGVRGHVMFVGINPSTADEFDDDPTIRRCCGFARRWGYGGFFMLNLFAWRATDPRRLRRNPLPIGPENDDYLRMYAESAGLVVAAWGATAAPWAWRACVVRHLLGDNVQCLGLTRAGWPRHPLYVRGDQPLERYDGLPAERRFTALDPDAEQTT